MGTATEKVKIRGLVVLSSWIFLFWGILVSAKGLFDLFLGEPEANLYAPKAWDFVSRSQWLRYGGFELAYGLACVAVFFYLRAYARFLPETVVRRLPDSGS